MIRFNALLITCLVISGVAAFLAEAQTNSQIIDTNKTTRQSGQSEAKASNLDWPRAIQAVASVANLLLVGYLFRLSNRFRSQERDNDFDDRELERKARIACFWIEELIIKPHHAKLLEFFDHYESRLRKLESDVAEVSNARGKRKASAEIEDFKVGYHSIDQCVIQPLILVNPGFQELQPLFGEIEDLVTNELSKIPGVPKSANSVKQSKPLPCEQLVELRCRFFKTVHRIQNQIVLEPRKKMSRLDTKRKSDPQGSPVTSTREACY